MPLKNQNRYFKITNSWWVMAKITSLLFSIFVYQVTVSPFREMNFIQKLSRRKAIQIKITIGVFGEVDKLTLKGEPGYI